MFKGDCGADDVVAEWCAFELYALYHCKVNKVENTESLRMICRFETAVEFQCFLSKLSGSIKD